MRISAPRTLLLLRSSKCTCYNAAVGGATARSSCCLLYTTTCGSSGVTDKEKHSSLGNGKVCRTRSFRVVAGPLYSLEEGETSSPPPGLVLKAKSRIYQEVLEPACSCDQSSWSVGSVVFVQKRQPHRTARGEAADVSEGCKSLPLCAALLQNVAPSKGKISFVAWYFPTSDAFAARLWDKVTTLVLDAQRRSATLPRHASATARSDLRVTRQRTKAVERGAPAVACTIEDATCTAATMSNHQTVLWLPF